MKVKMTGTAIINSVKTEGKGEKKKEVRSSKEFTVNHEYDVSEKEYNNIKQSCEKIKKYKNKQMKTE